MKPIKEILEKDKDIQKMLQDMASQLNLTNSEVEEPLILTEEEQSQAIYHAAKRLHEYRVWQLKKRMATNDEITAVTIEQFIPMIDAPAVIKKANSNKHYAIWQQEQRDKEIKQKEEEKDRIEKTWTASVMLDFMRWTSKEKFSKELIENRYNTPLIKVICFFLSNDPRFESELGYSFGKGLLIRGICGLGKTYLIKCVAENEKNPVFIKSMIEIADEVKDEGGYDLPIKKKWYIDDVGSETAPVNHYGTKINWLKDFIETYYLNQTDYSRLIISTNLNHAQLEEKYGFRFRSRVKDMFNTIDVIGEDLRGK